MNSASVLWYKQPAERWTDALPLGNGSLGAMVFGKTDKEEIELNLDTLWSGYPYKTQSVPGALEVYKEAQKLAFEGKRMEAQELIEKRVLNNRKSQMYLPLGTLRISAYNRAAPLSYERVLDLENGVHTVKAVTAGREGAEIHTCWEAFISYPMNCLMIRITTDGTMGVCISLDSQLRHSISIEDGLLVMDGQAPGSANGDRNRFVDDCGMFFRAALGVKTNGRLRPQAGVILADNAQEIVIALAAEDSFNGYRADPVTEGKDYQRPPVERVNEALEAEYEQVKQQHVRDYQALYGRVKLDLGESENAALPTGERLIRHDEGQWDPSLYTLYFNYARYLAISASRPGSQPMNLQGIWNDKLFAPWASNYTTNINTEMNYWPILPANLSELNEPLIQMIRELAEAGRETAQGMYDAKGWVTHHNTDLWRQTFPAKGQAVWGFWYNGGAWLSRHLFDHYLYTMDERFLKETAYPIIRGCAEFYMSLMVEDKNGRLMMAPSTSPENTFLADGKERCAISETTAMTMSIVRETLENAIKCAKLVKAEGDFEKKMEDALDRLYPLHVGSDGRLMEWYTEEEEAEIHHRHVSHLYCLHPSFEVSPESTPALAEACKRTLEVRGDDGTGWSLGWKINFWARLRDGNRALRLIDRQLRFVSEDTTVYTNGGGTYLNLFDAHPPFQIDGNFGAASGIMEMLLYPGRDEIILLPALPDQWEKGSVTGLKAPGGIEVSFEWENGRVTKAAFTACADALKKVRINGESAALSLKAGEKVEIKL